MPCSLQQIPDIILIVGTDAAGKDHVANIVQEMIYEAGGDVERRKRYLSGDVTEESSSSGKSTIELLLERCFLSLYPFFGGVLPWCLNKLLEHDLRRFARRPEAKLVIVGHNCLRGLAFYWGNRFQKTEEIKITQSLENTLLKMKSTPGLHTIVLDIDDHIRKKRIAVREELGVADNFDRYMVERAERSERIENCLVWLSKRYLNGFLINNNDLPEKELRSIILKSFTGQ